MAMNWQGPREDISSAIICDAKIFPLIRKSGTIFFKNHEVWEMYDNKSRFEEIQDWLLLDSVVTRVDDKIKD